MNALMKLGPGVRIIFFSYNELILFQMWFGIIKQLLPLSGGDMTICSPSTGNIAHELRPRAILPASGEQIVMSPSLKGNNCILIHGCGLKPAPDIVRFRLGCIGIYNTITEQFSKSLDEGFSVH